MISRMVLGVVAVSMIVGTGGGVALGAEPPKTTNENDIVYTKTGTVELKLDLTRPAEGDGPFPAVVVIHGGAWRGGNKADVRRSSRCLRSGGMSPSHPSIDFAQRTRFPHRFTT